MKNRLYIHPQDRKSTTVLATLLSICLLFTVIGNTLSTLDRSSPLNYLVYAQLVPVEYPFENSTHIQYNPGEDIYPKASARLILDLVENPEGISIGGQEYTPKYNSVLYDVNDQGKLKSYWLDLTNSGSNEVSISDTKIYPSFSFRVPVGSNSTVENVNEVSQFVDVDSIETLPDGISYSGSTTLPITINGTSYSNVTTIFDQFYNGSATLYLSSFEDS